MDKLDLIEALTGEFASSKADSDLTGMLGQIILTYLDGKEPIALGNASMSYTALNFASIFAGAELFEHIKRHGGEECVRDILDAQVGTFRGMIEETLSRHCELFELKNPLDCPTVNEATTAEILAEIEANKT